MPCGRSGRSGTLRSRNLPKDLCRGIRWSPPGYKSGCYVRYVRLLLDVDLGVTCDTCGEVGRQGDSLVEGVGMQGLSMSESGAHGLDTCPGHVVERILLCQGPAGSLAVGPKGQGLGILRIEGLHDRAARILAISMKWFIPIAQKKDRRGAKASTSIPALIPVRRYSRPSARV